MTTNSPYVLAWRLAGRKVVVVGGGAIGTAKVELLLATGARIVVVDPTPSDRVVELAAQSKLELRTRRARPTDMVRARLLVAATGCTTTNRRLRRWAHAAGAVVNAVDDQDNCDVTVPAIVRRGPATIAITTNGATPAGARFVREEVTALVDHGLPAGLGEVLDEAADARKELRHTGRYRYDYRRWRDRFFRPAIDGLRAERGAESSEVVGEVRRRFMEGFERASGGDLPGRVILVGAGPGGADLITVRGARALAAADVVVYDRLADPELLDLAPPAAERIPVGKSKGAGTTQEDINRILVDRAQAGSTVVRLKGGDPFVFGRGQEEVAAVTAAGLAAEVVPGISSAVSAPALAGISVTDRHHACSFTVLTGHRAGDVPSPERLNAAAGGGTVVVLMAATTAGQMAQDLLVGGRPRREPVAFIHRAGSPEQQVARATLADVAADGCPFPAPTVMVVGKVADQAGTASPSALHHIHAALPAFARP